MNVICFLIDKLCDEHKGLKVVYANPQCPNRYGWKGVITYMNRDNFWVKWENDTYNDNTRGQQYSREAFEGEYRYILPVAEWEQYDAAKGKKFWTVFNSLMKVKRLPVFLDEDSAIKYAEHKTRESKDELGYFVAEVTQLIEKKKPVIPIKKTKLK